MRKKIANEYLVGRGLEIGAFHNPWPTTPSMKMVYTDQNTIDYVIKKYNWTDFSKPIIKPDFIDHAQYLRHVPDGTFDFLLGSHVLEHCLSPLTALQNHVRVVRKGGLIIHAIPEKTQTFDRDRENADLSCIINDSIGFELNSDENKYKHYYDYFKHVDKLTDGPELDQKINAAIKNDEDVHFHAWDRYAMKDMIDFACKSYGMNLKHFQMVGHEVFVIMEKQ